MLCLVCLFGTIAPSKYVPAARIANCARLRREFLAHVARTGALRKTFISIKGIYYQAEVHGVSLTWVEPHHSFAQKPTMVVDYRVMLSFLELYEAVLTFVNFKLYHDGGLLYPPPIDDKADHSGAHLSAALAVPHSGPPTAKAVAEVAAGASKGRALPAPGRGTAPAPPSAAVLAGLHAKLAKVDRPPSGAEAAAEPTAGGEADAAEAEGGAEGGDGGAADGAFALSAGSIEEAAQSADTAAVRGLFTGCHFFCARETPVPALEFVLLSCGGRVGWEGEASPFARDDPRITHQVIDRPPSGDAAGGAGSADAAARRELVQPQWVFDCVNARAVLPTHAYRPGVQCPPHLSPFLDGGEGYEPKERVRQAAMEAAADAGGRLLEHEGGDADDGDGSGEEGSGEEGSGDDGSGEEGEEEEEEEEEDDDDDDDDDNDEARQYSRELASEFAGKSYAPQDGGSKKRRSMPADGAAGEEKALAMLMMSRKKRRLYDRMQYGIEKKKVAADVLRAKRDALDAAANAKGTKSKGKAGKAA